MNILEEKPINKENEQPNLISLFDVFDFMINTDKETIIRIIDFAQPLSGLCSVKEAADLRGITPPSYSSLNKYQKYKFLGKTFGFLPLDNNL